MHFGEKCMAKTFNNVQGVQLAEIEGFSLQKSFLVEKSEMVKSGSN